MNKNQNGFGHLEILLVVAVVISIGAAGWLVFKAQRQHKVSIKTSSSQTVGTKKASNSTVSSPSDGQQTGHIIDGAPSDNSEVILQQQKPLFNFVDTTGWASYSPKDSSYTIKFGPSNSYDRCINNDSTLLLGMVFWNNNCKGLKDAVSNVYTRCAFGLSEDLWDKGNADSVSVTLSDGTPAKRYKYINNIDGNNFYTIEYDMSHDGKDYNAILHWKSDVNMNNGGNVSPDYFDTVVQKTLQFN